MKIKKVAKIHPVALAALGVFLGRGAQADTVLDFQADPPDQPINSAPGILQSFGDNASASSEGVTITGGFGTPNIGLSWGLTNGSPDYRWDYYDDGSFWQVAQIQGSYVGVGHILTFTPNNNSVSAVIKSFNFFPYYDFATYGERFTYDVLVADGATVVSGPIHISFQSDASKNHPVNINYTGVAGHSLELRILRVASTLGAGEIEGEGYNIAVDDITFAQLPTNALAAGPQVVSVSPANNQTGVPATYYPYSASITNGSTALVANSIQLRLDGTLVSPAPTISSSGGVTNVNFLGTNLLSSGTHKYKLTFSDNLGSSYSDEANFNVSYVTLPPAYGLPPGAGVTRGFTFRTVSAFGQTTNIPGTVARAKAQLAGTLINTNTALPFTNSATLGTNADGSFNRDTVVNFIDTFTTAHGNFFFDELFPGLSEDTASDWFTTEANLYLDLPAGYYRFGVNSDDGFEASVAPRAGLAGSPIVLGLWDANRGADDTFFDVLVTSAGTYNFKVMEFESDGYASVEFFSVTNFATGGKLLVNDTVTDPNAIKSFRVLKPFITSIVKNGANMDIQWAYGTPPFQVQVKTNVNGATWTNSGGPVNTRSASVPMAGGTQFIRVAGSP